MESKDQIDTNLYSRQIGTFGIETMGKLIKMNVVIVGLRGNGVEIAKNLILAGPKSVSLYDPEVAAVRDLGANFYLEEGHVGKVSRADACLAKLQELNQYVKVGVLKTRDELNAAISSGNTHVVCQSEMLLNGEIYDPKELNEQCRANRVGHISTQVFGTWGYAFVDFGEEHIVTDHDGEQPKSFIVVMIEKGEKTKITMHEDKKHIYQTGDYVVLREVEGMSQINETKPIKVLDTTPQTVTLDLDSRNFSDYVRQGIIENVKVPNKISFHPWSQSYANPVASSPEGMLLTPDLAKFGRSDQLHAALYGIHQFTLANKRYPASGDVAACRELAVSQAKSNQYEVEIEDEVFAKAVSYAACAVSPLCAFFGGLVAQEIVKFTGKYSPLRQWLHFDIYETLPRGEVDRTPKNSRYDDQIAIYGRELQEKLGKVNLFMVGAGALGCELIKAYALMGVGCSAGGQVHCTDNDNIEVSNLNRQFLFRKQNVGHSKSETACAIAKGMNPQLNVKDYMTRVGPESEVMFNDKFWESLDFVVNAVDNMHARLYVDQRCVWYEKPLLESGTLGTKCNSQMVVPHVTQCYGDSRDPPEEAIPMCTLRNFPNQIEHCIEWGRDKFNSLFVDTPGDLVSFLDNSKLFVAQLKQNSTTSATIDTLTRIIKFIEMKGNNSFEACVALAREHFNDYFDYQIRDLLSLFPKDHKDKDGQPFWSGPKRCPSPIPFDASDDRHVNFVLTYANLIATALSIPENRDVAAVRELAKSAQVQAYVPKKIEVKLEENKNNNQPQPEPVASADDDAQIEALLGKLEQLKSAADKSQFQPAEFEKDDDSNFHIDFIDAGANLRAINYQIKPCDRQKTKMIAGKIIPAIATTTAMITGAVTAEIYKFVQGYKEIETFKNGFINLALPLFVFSEPMPVNKIKSKDYDPISMTSVKSIPEGYTIYDKTIVDIGSITFQEFFDHMEKEYNIEITLVSCGNYALYNGWLPGNKHAPRLQKKIEAVYNEIADEALPQGRGYLQLELGGSVKDDDDIDFQMPTTKYVFAKN